MCAGYILLVYVQPGDVLKLLGEGGLKIMTKLIHTIYETGTNAQSALLHIQQRYLEEGLKGKLRMYSEKISLDLEEEKELGMLRIISERTLEIEEELCLLNRLAEGI
jgi:hypothetical protein